MAGVVIGMDPHKRSATIEVCDQREHVLATGRFGTDRDGYRQLLAAGPAVARPALGGRGMFGRGIAPGAAVGCRR